MFFFEKKNQKTSVRLTFGCPGKRTPNAERRMNKVSLLLSLQRKKSF
jgi:hypothetical protein